MRSFSALFLLSCADLIGSHTLASDPSLRTNSRELRGRSRGGGRSRGRGGYSGGGGGSDLSTAEILGIIFGTIAGFFLLCWLISLCGDDEEVPIRNARRSSKSSKGDEEPGNNDEECEEDDGGCEEDDGGCEGGD